jgi:CHAT domain-containing protein/predicted negative regulator of RcsB-dependent stress response
MRALIVVVAVAILGQGNPTPEPLPAEGSGAERQLQAGVPHRYRVGLLARDFLHVTVEQRSLDVVVRATDAEGRALLEMDSPNGSFGLERIAIVAPADGTYDIEVRTPSAAPTGTYALEVKAQRRASDEDERHAAAERGFAEANVLRRSTTGDGRGRAPAAYAAASAQFKSLGLEYEELLSMYAQGLTLLAIGETRAAVGILSAAAPRLESRQDPLFPSVLNALGGGNDILGDLEGARRSYEQALAFFRAGGNRNGEATALNNIGKILSDRGDPQQALVSLEQALPLLRAAGNQRVLGVVLLNIGVAAVQLGDTERARENFGLAVEAARAAPDKGNEANALDQLAGLEAQQGEVPRALERLDQSLQLRRGLGDRRSEGITHAVRGDALLVAGEAERGLAAFEEALAAHRATGDRRNQGKDLTGLARAYSLLGQHEKAVAMSEEALAIFRAISDQNSAAFAQYQAGLAYRDLGRLAEAGRHAGESLSWIESQRARVTSGDARAMYFAQHHDVAMLLVDVYMQQHEKDRAAGHDRAALEVSERARARSLLDQLAEADARITRGAPRELVEREQRTAQQLSAKADRLTRLGGPSAAAKEAAVLVNEIRVLEGEYDQVRAEIRSASPAYAALTQPRPATVAEVQQDLLDEDTVLLQYALGPRAGYAWVVDKQSVTAERLPNEATFTAAVRDVRTLLKSPRDSSVAADFEAAVARLSDLAVGSLASRLRGKRVAVVTDGALQYIPFAMLTVPRESGGRSTLLERGEIVTLPSASAVLAQRAQRARQDRPALGLAVLADPVFGSTASGAPPGASRILAHLAPANGVSMQPIPPLPFTRTEATSILRTAANGKNFQALGLDATKELVTNGTLRDYRYVHFATHGVVDSERASLSAIVLSLVDAAGKPRDGFLRSHELFNLELRADLVVLSACETGLGRDIRGEGLIGLTRGFMYAGAPRVVVSLWSVSDRATAGLMTGFYEQMLKSGKPPAAALRSAQLAMLKQPATQHPFYWAAFVVQGDWR